jgi:hypothetical protein
MRQSGRAVHDLPEVREHRLLLPSERAARLGQVLTMNDAPASIEPKQEAIRTTDPTASPSKPCLPG